MVVKEIPVATDIENLEVPEEGEGALDEVLEEVEELPRQRKEETKPNKPVPKITKAKRQSKKEDPTIVDLKQRMPCPVCKRIFTLHSLLYRHKCTIDAREKIKNP